MTTIEINCDNIMRYLLKDSDNRDITAMKISKELSIDIKDVDLAAIRLVQDGYIKNIREKSQKPGSDIYSYWLLLTDKGKLWTEKDSYQAKANILMNINIDQIRILEYLNLNNKRISLAEAHSNFNFTANDFYNMYSDLSKNGYTENTMQDIWITQSGKNFLEINKDEIKFQKFLNLFNYLKTCNGFASVSNYLETKYGGNDRLYSYFEEKLINKRLVEKTNYEHSFRLKEHALDITDAQLRDIYFGAEQKINPLITIQEYVRNKIHNENSFNDNKGIVNQGSSFEDVDFRPAVNPIAHARSEHKKITTATIAKSLWIKISQNPLISAITALIIGTLILKYFHVI